MEKAVTPEFSLNLILTYIKYFGLLRELPCPSGVMSPLEGELPVGQVDRGIRKDGYFLRNG